jgi:predicted acetyltransferase
LAKAVNIFIDDLTDQQKAEVFQLQLGCFSDVPGREIEEDFFTTPLSRVLAYEKDRLVGCAGTRKRKISYEGQTISLGGISGVCTRSDRRGRGIATQVCTTAMQFLTELGCDVVFLSTSPMARRLYEKLGFQPLEQGFSWENIHGQVKVGTNGMLAPLRSPALAEAILRGRSVFHVGQGYW